MRNQRGFTLLELLITLVIIIVIVVAMVAAIIGKIDQARGFALAAEARMVRNTAQIVLIEHAAGAASDVHLYDEDLEVALSGTATEGIHWPAQVRLSQRMNALLAPDVVLAEEPGEDTSRAIFHVRDGSITLMVYEAQINGRTYRVTLETGQDAVTERVRGS